MATITISDISFNSETYMTELTKNDLNNTNGGWGDFLNYVEGGFQRFTDGYNTGINSSSYENSDFWYKLGYGTYGTVDPIFPD